MRAFGEDFNKIEIVEADLTNKESMINALEGVSIVLHIANPISPIEFIAYEDYVRPALEGA